MSIFIPVGFLYLPGPSALLLPGSCFAKTCFRHHEW